MLKYICILKNWGFKELYIKAKVELISSSQMDINSFYFSMFYWIIDFWQAIHTPPFFFFFSMVSWIIASCFSLLIWLILRVIRSFCIGCDYSDGIVQKLDPNFSFQLALYGPIAWILRSSLLFFMLLVGFVRPNHFNY